MTDNFRIGPAEAFDMWFYPSAGNEVTLRRVGGARMSLRSRVAAGRVCER